MAEHAWQKSSYSGGGGNNCIELAAAGDRVALRESTAPATVVTTGRAALRAFLHRVKAGHLDHPRG